MPHLYADKGWRDQVEIYIAAKEEEEERGLLTISAFIALPQMLYVRY